MRDFAPVIERCLQRLAQPTTGAARLFHGRGHSYPGYADITVDFVPPVVLVACFSGDEAGAMSLARLLFESLPDVEGVRVQLRDGRRTRFVQAAGTVPDELLAEEDGLKYLIRLTGNLHVGLFLDSAPAREWVRDKARDARVLNLFAYTCGFSVAAMAGGAKQVVNVDMSRRALDWGRQNHGFNAHDLRAVRMIAHDVLKSWSKLRQLGPYDLVIIDPPTSQRGSFNAERQYGQLLKRLKDLAAPGAYVLACLNSPFLHTDFLPAQMAKWCPRCSFLGYLPGSEDFPDVFVDRALKAAMFRHAG
jgi:23S rRNA (cytosine1962-C5)-methyltransferase